MSGDRESEKCLSGRASPSDEQSTGAAKHTPGPWKVYRNWRGKISVAADDGKRRICNVPTRQDGSGIQDARLIAAAPDLLEALRGLRDERPDGLCFDRCIAHGLQEHSPACAAARAALSKSGG